MMTDDAGQPIRFTNPKDARVYRILSKMFEKEPHTKGQFKGFVSRRDVASEWDEKIDIMDKDAVKTAVDNFRNHLIRLFRDKYGFHWTTLLIPEKESGYQLNPTGWAEGKLAVKRKDMPSSRKLDPKEE